VREVLGGSGTAREGEKRYPESLTPLYRKAKEPAGTTKKRRARVTFCLIEEKGEEKEFGKASV